jgi:uncharacterized protein YfaP (DUF2135 family)
MPMSFLEFSATGPAAPLERNLPKRPPRPFRAIIWTVVVVTVLPYSFHYPGKFEIDSSADNTSIRGRSIDVHGQIENQNIPALVIFSNNFTQRVAVENGQFNATVPLLPGQNVIQASVPGAASILLPGSNLIHVNADIPPAAIWSALTWDGPGDVDLHLILPDGKDCFFDQREVGGAVLDFDNTQSDGPEHITMDTAPPGTYQLRVVYYSGDRPNVHWRVDLLLKDGRDHRVYSGVLEKADPQSFQTVTQFSFP